MKIIKNSFKIQANGIGVIVNLSVAIICWFLLLMTIRSIVLEWTFIELVPLIIFSVACICSSIVAFKFKKFNFVEIEEDELRLSIYLTKCRNWPKLEEFTIKLNIVESVALRRLSRFSDPVLIIKRKNDAPYNVPIQPYFSKSDVVRLFEELEKRGILVETQ
jgi:hypothetical protein